MRARSSSRLISGNSRLIVASIWAGMILPTSVRNAVGLDSACLTRYETPPTLFNAALIISLMSRVSLFGIPAGRPWPDVLVGARLRPVGVARLDKSALFVL
jgi:hypothetical protein